VERIYELRTSGLRRDVGYSVCNEYSLVKYYVFNYDRVLVSVVSVSKYLRNQPWERTDFDYKTYINWI